MTNICNAPPFEQIFSIENLRNAYKIVQKGKRKTYRCYKFSFFADAEIERLHNELINGTYRPCPVRKFVVWCKSGQKRRLIAAPAFRDLIPQYALYSAIYPMFERSLIKDTYGCRIGGGAEKAANRVHDFIRRSKSGSFVLQLDVRRYYYTVDHSVLRKILERRLADPRLVDLCLAFCSEKIGLNVGATISQLIGLVYLDELDHYIKRVLKIKFYVRYVDDLVFLNLTKEEAHKLKHDVEQWLLSKRHLTLSKAKIFPTEKGLDFCGYRTFKKYRLVRRRSIKVFNAALRKRDFAAMESCLAHARHSASYNYYIKRILTLGLRYPKHIYRRIKEWQGFTNSKKA